MPISKDEGGEERVEQREDYKERWSPDWKVEEGLEVGKPQGEEEGDAVHGGDSGQRSPAEEQGAQGSEADAGGPPLFPVKELAGAAQPVS